MSKFDKNEILQQSHQHAFKFHKRNDEIVDEESRTAELSFSSDEPILHFYGYVILDHDPASVRMGRLKDNGALLWNHRSEDQLGAVVDATIDADGRGRATVKFSRGAKGEEKFQDVQDGIARSVSVGFMMYNLEPELDKDENQRMIGEYPVYRSTDWEPLEVSLVSVPRDIAVGVGRNLDNTKDKEIMSEAKKPEVIEAEPVTRAVEDQPAARTVEVVEAQPVERSNAEKVMDLATTLRFKEDSEEFAIVQRGALADTPIAEVRKELLGMRERTQAEIKPPVELTDKEQRKYSICDAIMADFEMRNGKTPKVGGFEREISEELEKNQNFERQHGGVLIPYNALNMAKPETRALNTQVATAGGDAVFETYQGFIDLLRNRSAVISMGATVLSGLRDNIAFVKQTGAATAVWMQEDPGADVPDSELTVGLVQMSPKTLMASTSFTRQMLTQGVVAMDNLAEEDLLRVNALEIDRTAIHGDTGANPQQPTGLYNLADVNAVPFGGPVTWDNLVDMETAIADDNAIVGDMGYLTNTAVVGVAKKTQQFTGTNGMALWEGRTGDGNLNGYRAMSSNQVSRQMLGSAETGGAEQGMLFGVWSQLLIGEWGVMELITDPYSLKKRGIIEVTTFCMLDINTRYGQSFAKATGQTL